MDWWDGIAPDLAVDHRIIRVDLIGHGGTEAPRYGYSIERQGALVSAILDQLGINRVTVIGHSMGGEVATALAEIEPGRIERMILIDRAGARFCSRLRCSGKIRRRFEAAHLYGVSIGP